ncbi:MAG: DUF4397 domain-containing protein [Myxococcales bacterium]|nr:DUF4397 domain-containing protein [Myxococcales bacterium]
MNLVKHSLGALCLSSAVLAGCADLQPGAESNSQALALPQSDDAVRVRFAHGAPFAPALDVYVGTAETPLFAGVAFGTATPYAALASGLQLVFRAAGAPVSAAPIATTDVVAQPGEQITTVAGGLVGSSAQSNRFRVQAYIEGFEAAERGQARVRFVQDSHGLSAAGFDLNADGSIEAAGVAAFTASDPAGVVVARARRSVQLGVVIDTPARQLTSFTLPASLLTQDGGIFLALVGVPTFVPRDPRGLALLAIGTDSAIVIRQNPSVYVLPAIPDSTGVDVFAVGRGLQVGRFAENVGFGVLAPVLQVAPTETGYRLIVRQASTDAANTTLGAALAVESTGPLEAGERYLAVASGFSDRSCGAGRDAVRVTIVRDDFDRTITGNGRLRAIAAAADAPAVDIGQFAPGDDTELIGIAGLDNLPYLASSAPEGAELTPDPLNPGVRVTGTTDTQGFLFRALSATDRAFGVVAGAFAPVTGDIQSRFIIVNTPASGVWTAQTLTPQF